jgi:hypothetical protein
MNTGSIKRSGLPASCPGTSDHSDSKHPHGPGVALTRYPSAHRASRNEIRFSCRSGLRQFLAGSPPIQAESSSLDVSDWSFTSSCSPPGFAATQLLSVTGRRTFARRGLAPLDAGTHTGAQGPPFGGQFYFAASHGAKPTWPCSASRNYSMTYMEPLLRRFLLDALRAATPAPPP